MSDWVRLGKKNVWKAAQKRSACGVARPDTAPRQRTPEDASRRDTARERAHPELRF